MLKFYSNVNTVICFLEDNNYSKSTIKRYQKVFESMAEYLRTNELNYSPDLGQRLLCSNQPVPFVTAGTMSNAPAVKKLNSVYETGSVFGVAVSSRKPYSKLDLLPSISEVLAEFMEDISPLFSVTQSENIRRRCSIFLKYLQHTGRTDVTDITYADVYDYHHSELSQLKVQSRIMEEGGLCHFFRVLAVKGMISHSIHTYMYALETNTFIEFPESDLADLKRIGHAASKTRSASAIYHQMINTLLDKFVEAGYVRRYQRSLTKAIRYFELFLDINDLDYTPEAVELWLNAGQTKEVFKGSSWLAARRALFLLKVYAQTETIDFSASMPRGISGLSGLPEWMLDPLIGYSERRKKEKLDEDTVNNDIYSILRFFRFLISNGITGFTDVSAETLTAFNLYDEHASSEGKNACNARIRKFLRYLWSEKLITNAALEKVLGYAAVRTERIVTVLDSDETAAIRNYVNNAVSPIQLQDSAVILLGTEMGIRGCDIVRIRIPDIDFKNKSIRLIQDKTDVEIQVAMPVSVGNAVFRYLRSGRPKRTDTDLLFLSLKAPYKPLSRNVCYTALRRILPHRTKPGSGFHVARKTFSTSKLRMGIAPERISSAIGQTDVKNLTPYLSLDGERMTLCPLSLEELGICMEGGF